MIETKNGRYKYFALSLKQDAVIHNNSIYFSAMNCLVLYILCAVHIVHAAYDSSHVNIKSEPSQVMDLNSRRQFKGSSLCLQKALIQ